MREVGADHTTVADDEDIVAVRMGHADRVQRAHDALLHAVKGFAPGRAGADGIADPARVGVAGQGADLLHRAPFPLTERQLAEIVHERERHTEVARDDLGGGARARERTRIDVGHRPPAKSLAEGGGLAPTQIRKRHVVRPLEPTDGVGERLAVPREQQSLHARVLAAASAHAAAPALRRASVSALPRMLMISKIGGLAVRPVSAMRVSWARSTSLSPSSAARPR